MAIAIGSRVRIATESDEYLAVVREIHPDHWVLNLEYDGLVDLILPNGLELGVVQPIEPFCAERMPQVGDIWRQCGVDFVVDKLIGDLVVLVSPIGTATYPAAYVCSRLELAA